MDQHTKDDFVSIRLLFYASQRHNHELQQMDAVSQTCADGVDEGDADSHPRHISAQDIQPHSMDVAVSSASACKRWRKSLTISDLVYGLRADYLCNVRKDQAEHFG